MSVTPGARCLDRYGKRRERLEITELITRGSGRSQVPTL